MDLGLYLFLYKIKHGDFAKKVKIWPNTLSQFIHGHNTPNLFNALKIFHESKGKVDLESLLSDEDRKYLEENYGIPERNTH